MRQTHVLGMSNCEQISFSPRLWETRGVTTLDNRVPEHNDTVTVEGRQGRFFVIGIDSINKTVDVRSASAPVVIVKGVPWTTISYPD